jgi:DNA-binding XRE family transcriptional regulator
MTRFKGAASRHTRNSVYGSWERSRTAPRIGLRVNSRLIVSTDFPVDPAAPSGFITIDDFLSEFTALPDIALRLPAARKALHRDNQGASSLADLRRIAGLSQTQLASIVGTSQPAISEYEAGEREPSIRVAARIAGALNVSLDALAKVVLK